MILGARKKRLSPSSGVDIALVRRNAGDWLTNSAAPTPDAALNAATDACFLRIANLDNGTFEWLGRYESAIAKTSSEKRFICSVQSGIIFDLSLAERSQAYHEPSIGRQAMTGHCPKARYDQGSVIL
jgi:hypothetical protein